MGRRSTREVWIDVLRALNSMNFQQFTASELSNMTGIKYETIKRILWIIELISRFGCLYRVKDRPRTYIWIPHENTSSALKNLAIRKLLTNETLSISELAKELSIDRKFAKKILNSIVDDGLAKWIDRETIISVLPPINDVRPIDLEKPFERLVPRR